MHLSGQLSDWSISDLLQIMQVTNKTGSLDIEGERRGRIHFRDGRVTGAELLGAKGSQPGSARSAVADVLYVLSSMASGRFAVGPADGPDGKGWLVEEVMSEVDDLRRLEDEVVDTGLFDATSVRLVNELQDPVTIDPADWHVLVNLVHPFTFADIEKEHGRGAAVRVLHTLHRLGIAEPVEVEEDETQWFDRLADDVSPGDAAEPWQSQVGEAEPGEKVAVSETLEPAETEEPSHAKVRAPTVLRGVAAPASTTLTDGVYDEIRRLRSRVGDK